MPSTVADTPIIYAADAYTPAQPGRLDKRSLNKRFNPAWTTQQTDQLKPCMAVMHLTKRPPGA